MNQNTCRRNNFSVHFASLKVIKNATYESMKEFTPEKNLINVSYVTFAPLKRVTSRDTNGKSILESSLFSAIFAITNAVINEI